MKHWLALELRVLAMRLDGTTAYVDTGLSFTYGPGAGLTMHGEWGTFVAGKPRPGVPLLYRASDYPRVWEANR